MVVIRRESEKQRNFDFQIPKLIGVTGGIASGKSRVASCLARRTECPYVDADKIARELFTSPGKGLDGLNKLIGDRFFLADGLLDRKMLRREIFRDSDLRHKVDRYTHPLIWDLTQQAVSSFSPSEHYIIVEVPLLFEAGWQDFFQTVVVVYSDHQTCVARLAHRDSLTVVEANLAYEVQESLFEKALLADHVIDNSGSWSGTILEIHRLSCLFLIKNT